MVRVVGFIVLVIVCAMSTVRAEAGLFTIKNDMYNGVYQSLQYVGNSPSLGYSSDGGSDAFDGFGRYLSSIGNVTLQRQSDAIQSINSYRWLDTFTNNTANAIIQQVTFFGDLGSDGSEFVSYDDGLLIVSRDGGTTSSQSDPVLALLNGNNAWALANMDSSITPNQYRSITTLSLAPGQSISLLHFASLARPNDINSAYDAVGTGTVANALAMGLSLKGSPYLTGLTSQQISSIANFDTSTPAVTPEPTSLALAGFAGFGMAVGAWRGRRQGKPQAA